MKVRIKSHSVRFRLDNAELEELFGKGMLQEVTHIPSASGETTSYILEVRRGDLDEESGLRPQPYGLTLLLSPEDCAQLGKDDTDGIYLRRDWTNDAGHQIRFVAYIEKDKKARKHGRAGLAGEASEADQL